MFIVLSYRLCAQALLAQRFEQNTWSDLNGINILEQSLAIHLLTEISLIQVQ